jgi:N-acetylglucosamine-6-phosphate deacetylase
MGFSDRGVIEAGSRADLVLLDDELQVTRVMRSGNWLV